MISKTAIIHPNVILGDNVTIEDQCIIGNPLANQPELKTVIGDYAVIRAGTIIYAGNRIGKNFQTGNRANIRECNEIGDNVSIGTLTVVEHHVKIGEGSRIHSQAFIPEYSELKKNAWVGPNVVFTNAKYPKSPNAKTELIGPTIGENAKVGANSTLLPGVNVGDNSLVGAGSLVSKDVPENSIVAGHPAKFIKKIDY